MVGSDFAIVLSGGILNVRWYYAQSSGILRHSGESRNPEVSTDTALPSGGVWIPAFAGMTVLNDPSPTHVEDTHV